MKRMNNGAIWALGLTVVLCVPTVWAQQKDPRIPPVAPQAPLPAGDSSSRANTDANAAPAPQNEKVPPLTSAEGWRLGKASSRNYFVPSFSFSQGGDTNPGNGSSENNEGVQSATSLRGEVAFHRLSGLSEFTGTYSGGANFYTSNRDLNNWFQHLELLQKVSGRRSALLIGDTVDFREDPFGGYGGFGNLPGGLGGLNGSSILNPGLFPSQTVSTGSVPQISNTAFVEWQHTATRRSSFTVTGAYGLLRYFETGLNDTNNIHAGAGYNYALSSRDTLAVKYSASLFRFPGFDQKNDSHAMHLSYRRLLTGRMVFDIGAGPQITLVNNPAGSRRVDSWSLSTSLGYRLRRSSLGVSYDHSTTGGSGFFLGAVTDNVGGTWTLPISRMWSVTWDFGYAHNRPIGTSSTANPIYDTWRGGLRLERPMGRYGYVSFNYRAEHQKARGNTACPGGACGFFGTRQLFGIGFNFRFKPVELD